MRAFSLYEGLSFLVFSVWIMEDRLRRLAIDDESDEGFEYPKLGEGQVPLGYDLCLVGTLVTDKPFNFLVMKYRMASLRRPRRGLFIKDLEIS